MMKMSFLKCLLVALLVFSCDNVDTPLDPLPEEPMGFARGADISWCTEMEAEGIKFYNKEGQERDIFVLMKEIGMTAVRLRVWVDPLSYGYGPWCDKADVVLKAKRAHAQGLDVMINFHYSDFFTDPGRQNTPVAWNDMNLFQLRNAMADHTKDVLNALKNEGITPKWVQVGNETNSGILMMQGKVDFDKKGPERFANYTALSNAGYDAVKSVFPSAKVIVHLGGTENADWFFTDFKACGGKFDIIGLSHYPTEDQWDSEDDSAVHSNIIAAKLVKAAALKFKVPVMLVETGFELHNQELGDVVMRDLFTRMREIEECPGIFYWEPQVDGRWKPKFYDSLNWGAYGKGGFTPDWKPTIMLDAFQEPQE